MFQIVIARICIDVVCCGEWGTQLHLGGQWFLLEVAFHQVYYPGYLIL